jgi:LmbE family N-acetylglucosaminyl deacetylase
MTAKASASSGSVLIVAPHPDDDLLFGAGVVATARAEGRDVKVVYMTNGDIGGQSAGLDREDEAVNGQNIIGTSEDDLIFLGYPDGYLQDLRLDYNKSTDVFTAPSTGLSATYGDRGLGRSDYHTFKFGSAATYNGADVEADLLSIIETYRPSDIYTTSEFDSHPDHLSTYYFVRSAVMAVMQSDSTYTPTLHKTIVWWNQDATWAGSVNPQTDVAEIPDLSETGLSWADRESLVVPEAMQSTDLQNNPKYQAIQAHQSQGGAGGYLEPRPHSKRRCRSGGNHRKCRHPGRLSKLRP